MSNDLRATYNTIAADFAADHQHDSWVEDFYTILRSITADSLTFDWAGRWEMQRMARAGLTKLVLICLTNY